MKSPAFQFYPSDFLGSGKVGTMTTEEIGAYTLLLCLDWNETGFEFDEEELSRWCRLSRAKFRKVWHRVSRCFVEREGRLFNPRLDAEREKQAEWRRKSAEGGRASAQARGKGGGKGGSTTLEPPTQPNANTLSPTPSLPNNSPPPPAAEFDPIAELLAAIPEDSRAAWSAEIAVQESGMHGPPVPRERTIVAAREFIANGGLRDRPSLRHFRGYLQREPASTAQRSPRHAATSAGAQMVANIMGNPK